MPQTRCRHTLNTSNRAHAPAHAHTQLREGVSTRTQGEGRTDVYLPCSGPSPVAQSGANGRYAGDSICIAGLNVRSCLCVYLGTVHSIEFALNVLEECKRISFRKVGFTKYQVAWLNARRHRIAPNPTHQKKSTQAHQEKVSRPPLHSVDIAIRCLLQQVVGRLKPRRQNTAFRLI